MHRGPTNRLGDVQARVSQELNRERNVTFFSRACCIAAAFSAIVVLGGCTSAGVSKMFSGAVSGRIDQHYREKFYQDRGYSSREAKQRAEEDRIVGK